MPSSDLAATPNSSSPLPADRLLRLRAKTPGLNSPVVRELIRISPVIVLFLWTFRFGLIRFWLRVNPFTGDPDWGHALFIPMVGLFYLHANRDRLERCRIDSFRPGWVLLIAALFIYAYGLWTWRYFVEPGDFVVNG